MTSLHDQILRMEEALTSPEVRASELALSNILHPEFKEIGKSGRTFDFNDIIQDVMKDQSGSTYIIANFHVSEIADGVALATYQIPARTIEGREYPSSMRSSLWTKVDGIWLLRFHQGTIAPAE